MKELIEKMDGYTQIFEQDCFGKGIDARDVETFIVHKDSWIVDQDGEPVRKIHKAEVVKLSKHD